MVSSKEFLVDIPSLHPLSSAYKTFWREQKRRCIEGYWVSGRWMPPTLYFYANFGTIKIKKKGRNYKMFGRPWLRDLEWETFYHYAEARGFSGFMYDDEYTCNREILKDELDFDFLKEECPHVFNSEGKIKKYIPARDYMRKIHHTDLGPAVYENSTYNLMMMGSRETGKSYMVAVGMVLHNFLFDGATVYNEESILHPQPIETLVGAEDSKYSGDILLKAKEALENLPGRTVVGERVYPSPFSKQYKGSWAPGSGIMHFYKKKFPGGWDTVGSKSTIKHRTFNDNAYAAQGTRPALMVLEECGMLSNLKDIYTNTVDNFRVGLWRVGTLMMLGTGGDMDKGTLDASEMFYEPEKYDILPFDDIWENRGKIAYFIPAYMALNEHKNDNGDTNKEAAIAALKKERDKKRKAGGSSDALNKEMQYRPIVPSEMFLARNANIFPTAELRNRLTKVLNENLYEQAEKKVDLYFDSTSTTYNGVNYSLNNNNTAISRFPFEEDDREGSVVIYEFPQLIDGVVPPGAYVIGCDPFKDDSATGNSLAAIYVMKTNKYFSQIGHDEIVASYIGRPYQGKNAVNEILHKLALFYNAKIYFENAVGNVKDYFERVKRLDLLATQPVTIFNKKASYNTNTPMIYGYPMSNQKVKWEAIQYLRNWVLEERSLDGEGTLRNLDLILDIGLLQELLAFTMDGNFDRVMGLAGCVIGLEETFNINKRRDEAAMSQTHVEFNNFIVNNTKLFRNEKISATTDQLLEESQG
jgi:hypothetical protein